MLATRIGQLTAWGLSPHKIRGFADRSPDIISAILSRLGGIGPLPRNVLPVHLPVSSRKATASPQTSQVRHTKNTPCNATWTGYLFSGLRFDMPFDRLTAMSSVEWLTALSTFEGQSFLYVQAPTLARPPGCTHRSSSEWTGQPGLPAIALAQARRAGRLHYA
jgi:hypothetical protein